MNNIDKKLQEQTEPINELLRAHTTPNRHSYFQLKVFNLNLEPTIQGKLRRCLLELQARRDTLVENTLGIEEANDQIEFLKLNGEFLEENLREESDPRKRKMIEIEIRRNKRRIESQTIQLAEIQKRYKETLEESLFFVDAFKALELQEPLRPYDDPDAQLEYWSAKYEREYISRCMAGQPCDHQLVQEILALPENSGIRKLIQEVNNGSAQQKTISKNE